MVKFKVSRVHGAIRCREIDGAVVGNARRGVRKLFNAVDALKMGRCTTLVLWEHGVLNRHRHQVVEELISENVRHSLMEGWWQICLLCRSIAKFLVRSKLKLGMNCAVEVTTATASL